MTLSEGLRPNRELPWSGLESDPKTNDPIDTFGLIGYNIRGQGMRMQLGRALVPYTTSGIDTSNLQFGLPGSVRFKAWSSADKVFDLDPERIRDIGARGQEFIRLFAELSVATRAAKLAREIGETVAQLGLDYFEYKNEAAGIVTIVRRQRDIIIPDEIIKASQGLVSMGVVRVDDHFEKGLPVSYKLSNYTKNFI